MESGETLVALVGSPAHAPLNASAPRPGNGSWHRRGCCVGTKQYSANDPGDARSTEIGRSSGPTVPRSDAPSYSDWRVWRREDHNCSSYCFGAATYRRGLAIRQHCRATSGNNDSGMGRLGSVTAGQDPRVDRPHPGDAPSRGGHGPNAERTVGPARNFIGSLTQNPELESSQGQKRR